MENVNSEASAFKVKKKTDFILPFLKSGDFWFAFLAFVAFSFINVWFPILIAVFIMLVIPAERMHYYAEGFVAFIVFRFIMANSSIELMDGILTLGSLLFLPFLGVILLLALSIPVADFKRVRREIRYDAIGMVQNEESVTNIMYEVNEIMINSGRGLVNLCLESKQFVSMLKRVIFLVFIVMFLSLASTRGCNDEMCGIPVFLEPC